MANQKKMNKYMAYKRMKMNTERVQKGFSMCLNAGVYVCMYTAFVKSLKHVQHIHGNMSGCEH